MGLKKIKRKLKVLLDDIYWAGWSDGYEKADNEKGDFEEGWCARGENIQTRLKMLEEAYMAEGKGNKAVLVREIAELIAIEINPEDSVDW
jgi:hypothetical protein